MLAKPDPCPCGNPLPALRVQGRSGDTLTVPLRPAPNADPEVVWHRVHDELRRLLTDHRLDNVTIERAEEPPEQAPGGKYRTVIPLQEP